MGYIGHAEGEKQEVSKQTERSSTITPKEIIRLFFPRWHKHRQWRFTTNSRRTTDGYCDSEHRVITIPKSGVRDAVDRDAVVIHEICHAVTSGGHGKRWINRMKKAAMRAESLAKHSLSSRLLKEIEGQLFPNVIPSRVQELDVYGSVRDYVFENPDATLPEIKRVIAGRYGLLPSEVHKSFTRLRKVFQLAKKHSLLYHKNLLQKGNRE